MKKINIFGVKLIVSAISGLMMWVGSSYAAE